MSNTISRGFVALGVALGLFAAHAVPVRAADKSKPIAIADVKRAEPVSFEKDVLPIFKKNCLACHNATEAESDLVLETPASIIKGGASGPAVMPKKSGESWLMQVATHAEEPIMPPKDNKVNAKNLTPQELGLIKLWIDQGATGTVTGDKVVWQPLPAGVNPIYAAAVSPDGQYAACGRANQIFIYHIPTGREVCRLTDPALLQGGVYKQPGVAHLDLVQSLAFSPDGQTLASGGYQVVKLWRRPRNTQLHKFASPEGASVVAASADGKWLAVGGGDVIHLWDLAAGKPGATLKGHTGAVTCLSFSADGAKLYSGSADKSLRVWTIADGKLAARIDTPNPISALTVVGDGSQVATGGGDNAIHLWSVPATPLAPLAGVPSPPTAMAASADKKWLALGGADGKIALVEADSGKVTKTLSGHSGAITSLSFNANASRLASGSADKTAKVWDVAKGEAVDTIPISADSPVERRGAQPRRRPIGGGQRTRDRRRLQGRR